MQKCKVAAVQRLLTDTQKEDEPNNVMPTHAGCSQHAGLSNVSGKFSGRKTCGKVHSQLSHLKQTFRALYSYV